MRTPLGQAKSVGELTSWGKAFLEELQSERLLEIQFQASVDQLAKEHGGHPTLLFIENSSSQSCHWIAGIRKKLKNCYIVWFGKAFSKEDLQFALAHRIYTVFENVLATEERVEQDLHRLLKAIERQNSRCLVLQAIKSLLIQSEGDLARPLMAEFKAAVTKLEDGLKFNEFSGHAHHASSQNTEEKLLFHVSESLKDVISTIDNLERTGVLWVKSNQEGEEGKIEFLQGRVVSASAGEARGLKAIYRMFLWLNPRFLFTRRDHGEFTIQERINLTCEQIIVQGESYRTRFLKIREELPPSDIMLELEPKALSAETRLEKEDFLTLASVVEYGRVSEILDYNELSDALLLEGLIRLRRKNLIRIVA